MANERKVQDDLRRIIGVDGFKKGISAPEEKPPVKGVRGIVYFDSSGNSQSTSGTPAEDMQPGADEEEGGQDAGQGDGQGSSGGSNGGNTLETDGVDSPYPVEDATSEGDGIFSVDDLRLGDQLKGLSGLYDCATGDPVSVRFDGQFTAPDGWEDADTPAGQPYFEDDGYWESGYYYFAFGSGPTPSSVCADGWSIWEDDVGLVCSRYPNWLGNDYRRIQKYECSSDDISNNRYGCGLTPYDTDPSIVATSWPSDKPMQLSYDADTGKYMTNQYDSNVTPEYSQPTSTISLCDGNGDSVIITPTADGGKRVYIPALGYAVFSDENGKITGFGDGAEMTARLPR